MRTWRSPRRAALVAALALFVSVAPAAPATAVDNRTLAGHVYLGDTSRSATAGEVRVSLLYYGQSNPPTVFADTDSAGNYAFSGLAPNYYSLRFDYPGGTEFGSLIWPDKAPSFSLTTGNFIINLTAGNKTDADITLHPPASITGTVTLGSAAQPAGAGEVAVYYTVARGLSSPTWLAPPVYTDALGQYVLPNVVSGRYEVWFDYLGSGPYLDVYYGNGFSATARTTIEFPAGVSSVRDMTLPLKRQFSGTVTLEDPGNGRPSGSVKAGTDEVEVRWAYSPTFGGPFVWSNNPGLTNATGAYVIPELDWGYYLLEFVEVGAPGNHRSFTRGTTSSPVTLLNNSKVESASLVRTYAVSGHIDIDSIGNSAGDGEVFVKVMSNGSTVAQTRTNAAGNYLMPAVVSTQTVSMHFGTDSSDWVTTRTPDFALGSDIVRNQLVERAAILTGTLYNEFGGPVTGWVYVYPCAAAGTNPAASYWTLSGSDGHYGIRIDHYGSYYVSVSPIDTYNYQARPLDPGDPDCFDTTGGGTVARDIAIPRAGAVVVHLAGPGASGPALFKTHVELWRYQGSDASWVAAGESGDISEDVIYFHPVAAGLYVLVTRYYGSSGTVKTSVDHPFPVRGDARFIEINVAAVSGASAARSPNTASAADAPDWTALLATEAGPIHALRNFAGR